MHNQNERKKSSTTFLPFYSRLIDSSIFLVWYSIFRWFQILPRVNQPLAWIRYATKTNCPRVGQILFFCRRLSEIIVNSEANESITLSDKKLLLPAIRISLPSSVPCCFYAYFLRPFPFSFSASHVRYTCDERLPNSVQTLRATLARSLRFSDVYLPWNTINWNF